jgi:small subunit ribosomal protein S4e
VKQHIKRISAPKTWNLLRKEYTFVARPRPGRHGLTRGLPLILVVRDMIHAVDTVKELKYLINNKVILINDKIVTDPRTLIGFMDILSFHSQHYRITKNQYGQLTCIPITQDTDKRIDKITNKTLVKGKTQVTLLSGMTFITNEKYAVGDSLLFVQNKVSQHFPLKEGMSALVYQGKYVGNIITITLIERQLVHFLLNGEKVKTKKAYVLVVGNKEPVIKNLVDTHD